MFTVEVHTEHHGVIRYDAAKSYNIDNDYLVIVRADDTVSTFAPGTWYHVAATPENG